MKRFACGDVIPGCDAAFTAPGEDEVLALAGAHAATVHGVTDPTPELVATVRSPIHDA
jgi:predicted small metal-binding protein